MRSCGYCGESLEGRPGKTKWCKEACRKAASRNPDGVPAKRTSKSDEPSGFYSATLAELEHLQKTSTMLGQQVLVIAQRMGDADEGGSAIVTLSKEHSRLMAAISAGARTADPVDEARASRERMEREAREAGG